MRLGQDRPYFNFLTTADLNILYHHILFLYPCLWTYLVIVEHGGAVHGRSSVPCAELVQAIKDWAIVADVEVI